MVRGFARVDRTRVQAGAAGRSATAPPADAPHGCPELPIYAEARGAVAHASVGRPCGLPYLRRPTGARHRQELPVAVPRSPQGGQAIPAASAAWLTGRS